MIVTGDDFGLSIPVNEAIAKAHQNGILTTTSLMVAAPAVADAIDRAKSLPNLKVGLHLVLTSGRSCLTAVEIPDLVDSRQEFSKNQVTSGIKIFFLPRVKKQLTAEINAQFEVFKRTGLKLDHVNTHKHIHLHPTVLDLILRIGEDYGLTSVRLPDEPPLDALINSRKEKLYRYVRWLFLKPWVSIMKKRLDNNNIRHNDIIYGIHDSGHMNIDTLIRIISHLPDGLSEVYTHPATELWDTIETEAKDYEYEAEYKALIHPRIKRAVEKFSIRLTSFSE